MPQIALSFDRDAFDVPVPAAKGSAASARAADRLKALGAQGRKMARLLETYAAAAPGTLIAFEVETRTGLLSCSICSLRHNAVRRAWLVAVGVRPGPYGVEQTTHRITDAGRDALAKWRTRQQQPPSRRDVRRGV